MEAMRIVCNSLDSSGSVWTSDPCPIEVFISSEPIFISKTVMRGLSGCDRYSNMTNLPRNLPVGSVYFISLFLFS